MEMWNTNMFIGLAVLVCLATVYAQGDEGQIAVAILGKAHTFKCDLSPGDNGIQWRDNVYNMEANKPATIFDSQDNADLNVANEHPINSRLSVNARFELKIEALEEDDAGLYFCQTTGADGNVQQQRYSLTLGGAPACEGETEDRRPGDQVELSCSMSFSGSETPVLEWFADDTMIDSNDAYSIMLAKKTVDLDVAPSMDRVEYKCRATFGELVEECGFTMEVKYATQDLTIVPDGEVAVNQEVQCSAIGNPIPTITLTLPDKTQKTGENMVSFTVSEDLRGSDIDVTCSAENTLDGSPNMQQISTILTVIDETTPPPKEEPEPSDEADNSAHNTHPEEGEIKTEEEPAPGQGSGSPPGTDKAIPTTGIIAGIVVAAIVLVLIIIIVVCIKRRQAKKPPKGAKKVPTKKKKVPTATLR